MYTKKYNIWIRRLFFAWIAVIVVLAVVYGIFLSPISPFHYCTLIGCRDTLELTFTHEPPTQYSILLTAQDGETRSLTCTPGESTAANGVSATCRKGIVTIYGFTPGKVAVDISWQGGSYSTTGNPDYRTFRPNGLFCPPACRLGKLTIAIP